MNVRVVVFFPAYIASCGGPPAAAGGDAGSGEVVARVAVSDRSSVERGGERGSAGESAVAAVGEGARPGG